MARTTIHLSEALDSYRPSNGQELADLGRIRAALGTEDIFSRSSRLHVTASALVVHPPSRRVLLRWHTKMERWMQVGGHFDPGETDPRQVALREAYEETGLSDLGSPQAPAIGRCKSSSFPSPRTATRTRTNTRTSATSS